MTYLECTTCHTVLHVFLKVATFMVTSWMFMWFGNEYLADYLDHKIEWTKKPLQRFAVGILVMVVYTLIAIVLLTKFFELVFSMRFSSLEQTGYTTIAITFVITLFMTSRSFLFNWRDMAIESEKFKKESSIAKYESLKNQVNPHFLFNSFNALTNLVYDDQDKAVKFIKQLSEVYRYVLDTRDKEVVNLADERKFLDAYLFLQQIRFGEKLKMDVRLADVESMVAPLVLQMLVENAIKHNVISEDNPLTIRLFAEGGFIVVENNLQKKSVTLEESSGLGLENIVKRYEFLSDKAVEVVQNEKFTVKLPILPA
ncbi:sensor histidine kinase [Chryseolinea lacunae]|uniref:Histidine kinase n=1 Tax=Chryseolinea lacunae TaxID=2801331 RepID=A0ABS1KX20_9BACT|nr:histidine kinase [Chryseolinea lacunae]MBL0743870.1 histidine kinase [Chryseolinea lacunae]